MNNPVPIATRATIIFIPTASVADAPIQYPAAIRAIPTGTQYLAPINLSEIYPPIIGAKYVNATRFDWISAASTLVRPNPPVTTVAATKT